MAKTQILIDAPMQVTHHARGWRPNKPKIGLGTRLQAAFGAFVAPQRLNATPASNDNTSRPSESSSLADPLALPPDWHGHGDIFALSFLPFDR